MNETKKALYKLNKQALGMTVFHVKYGRGKVVYSGGQYWEIRFDELQKAGSRPKLLNAYSCFAQGLLSSADVAFDRALRAVLKQLQDEKDNKKALAGI